MEKLPKVKYKNLAPFYFKKIVNDRYLLTNEAGCYHFLNKGDFFDFVEGSLSKDSESYVSLLKKGFIKSADGEKLLIDKYASRHDFLLGGPSLHIVVVTLRCNYQCLYCHASAQEIKRKDLDMDKKTAERVVDTILKSTNHCVAIEFQGGEPLLNWPIVKFIIEDALKKNKKIKKDLQIRLVTNLSLMTKDKLDFLVSKDVSICTSLDGPKDLHNRNRPTLGGINSYNNTIKWIKYFNKIYSKLREGGYIYKLGGIVTVSRFSLNKYKEMVDEYMRLGFTDFFLRPLNPFGFSVRRWKEIGYGPEEYIKFYKDALDYIIDLNLNGKVFMERAAVIYLKKIFSDMDPGYLELRSPCGAAIGQIAYNWNGDVYTCDEGRMLSMMGDENFKLGSVEKDSYRDMVGHTVARSLCTASCLDGLPGCNDCVYKPYCGVCPIFNYVTQGNIFGQLPANDRCKINKAILTYLFECLSDEKVKKILIGWVKHFKF